MTNRIVTGAHYGLRDWLVQRISGLLIAIYALILAAALLSGPPLTYSTWHDLFAKGWMRVATLLLAASLAWHAWVGMRNILMDYAKPTWVRLAFEIGTVLVLAGYLGWTVQILWR